MALHDFECSVCGYVLVDYNVPIALGAVKGAPDCPRCGITGVPAPGVHAAQPMHWIPQIGRVDALGPMQEFEVFDGRGQRVVVESLRQMRTIERESEQHARNGEGQRMAWRAYSNDDSNRHDHLFTTDTSRAMDHDLHETRDQEVGFAGRSVRMTPGESIPFRTDGKTTRGVPLTKKTGRAVTKAHGTVDDG